MIWVRTSSGKMLPVDAEPVNRRDAGAKAVLFDLTELPNEKDRFGNAIVEARATRGDGHVAHWATCQEPDSFRRKR
jgi:hypothetical protein